MLWAGQVLHGYHIYIYIFVIYNILYIHTLESSYKNPASERKSIDGEMSRSNEAQRYPPSCLGTGHLEGIQNKRNLGLNKQLIEEMDNSSFL